MNIQSVVTLEFVTDDLKDGEYFYESNEPGIGRYFLDSLVSDIESLKLYAGTHHKKYGLHRMFAKRFPYAIYYKIGNQTAYVIAVLSMKRNPRWIKKQLEEREN